MALFAWVELKTLFTLVSLVLFLHELEEWNIDVYHRKQYTGITVQETKLSVRLWLFFLSFIGFFWAWVANFIPDLSISAAFFMLLIDFIFLNGLQHVLISLKTRKYNPGLIFGGVVGLLLNGLVVMKIVMDQVLPLWLVIGFLLLLVPGLIQSIRSLNSSQMPAILTRILRFSLKLEKWMTE